MAKAIQFRLRESLLHHLEQVMAEFGLPSLNAALNYILARDQKRSPSSGRHTQSDSK